MCLKGFKTITFLTLLTMAGLTSSCIKEAGNSRLLASEEINNTPATVDVGYGRILQDNPTILSGNNNLSSNADLNKYLRPEQDFITFGQYLIEDCNSLSNPCFEVKSEESASYLNSIEGKWAFNANSSQFLQVHTFGHTNKIVDLFHYSLGQAVTTLSATTDTAFPLVLGSLDPLATWLVDEDGATDTLKIYTEGADEANAYFSPAYGTITYGVDPNFPGLKFAQDSTVIYHETGHVMSTIMLNMRNYANNAGGPTAQMYTMFYDELGAIAEGLSDFFSYLVNGRTHIGEWVLGFYDLTRPMSEDDPIHAGGISTDEDSRLRYPTYLSYDANDPQTTYEDIHYAGQIMSHFLVALSEDLKDKCGYAHSEYPSSNSIAYTMLHILTETLSELGDLGTAVTDPKGRENLAAGSINLDYVNAAEWYSKINPINYRKFSQVLAKNVYKRIINGSCMFNYTKNDLEALLDQYGLLLFNSYNFDGGKLGSTTPGLTVDVANRLRTTLIPKDFLKIDPRENAVKAYVFDRRNDMVSAMRSLNSSKQIYSSGQTPPTHLIADNLPYNNGNSEISPGEIVGISLNLYNSSNSEMGGIQVLANDWDHVSDTGYPCNSASNGFTDEWPLDTEGGVVDNGCQTVTPNNSAVKPVCFVTLRDDNETRWVRQSELQEAIHLDESKCLSGGTSGGDEDDCFVRAIKGADHAYFSKIEPQKNWVETFAPDTGTPSFTYSNLLFFEINPRTPPGTVVNCRFRARFTNCSDCFENGTDEFEDYKYSGPEPFEILHLQFEIIN